MKPRSGVTLLEQVLVLALLGVMLWAARPVVSGVSLRWRLGSALHQVRMVLLEAQARSVAEGVARRVGFAEGGTRVAVEVLRGELWVAEASLDLPAGVSVETTSFPGYRVAFGALGAPDAGGEAILRAGARTGRVRVEADTGLVRCMP